jgi:SAM-dependent methyltransferase
MLERAGYAVKGLDIAPAPGVDVVGTAEATGLTDGSVDLVLCTQVLEHTRAPWLAMREFARILRPGGSLVISIPHVWFFHPHPHDYWRVTAEGMAALFDDGGFETGRIYAQGSSAAALFQVVNFLAFGALGRAGAPVYAVCNLLGRAADALVSDTRFALNHVGVATKRNRG